MGYYDRALMHADKRNKGMNSTTNEKGADGKKNNSSEYNHQYYMKNKEKWTKKADFKENDGNDKDFDESNYDEKNRLGDTDFYGKQNADGSWTILDEDMKWKIPAGATKEEITKVLETFSKQLEKDREDPNWSPDKFKAKTNDVMNSLIKGNNKTTEQEFDVDAAARDVISGKYKNGAERKAALGDDYEAVQKRVNEMMKKSKSAKHSDDDQNELYHHGILGQKWGVRRFENKNGTLTAAGKARYDDGKVSAKEKNAFSLKAAGHKAMAKVYGANEKAYAKSNKTLANMNAHAKNEQLKKAEAAQKEANDKRDAKIKKALESEGNSKFNSDTVKKVAKVGAVAAGTALAVYGAYKVNQLNDKATSGIRKDAASAAKHLEAMSNFNRQSAGIEREYAAKMLRNGNTTEHKRLMEGANRSQNLADKMLGDAIDAARKANQNRYSVKEKVDWLKKNR